MPEGPIAIGCFKCGEAFEPRLTVFARCEDCAKTVGVCLGCADTLPDARRFIDDSLEWHQLRACLSLRVESILSAMRGPDPAVTAKLERARKRGRVINAFARAGGA